MATDRVGFGSTRVACNPPQNWPRAFFLISNHTHYNVVHFLFKKKIHPYRVKGESQTCELMFLQGTCRLLYYNSIAYSTTTVLHPILTKKYTGHMTRVGENKSTQNLDPSWRQLGANFENTHPSWTQQTHCRTHPRYEQAGVSGSPVLTKPIAIWVAMWDKA